MNAIVARLKKRKQELGLTNQELSTVSGVPYGTVCRVFSKIDGTPNWQTIKDLAKAMDISVDELVDLEEGRSSAPAGEVKAPEPEKPASEETKINSDVLATVVQSYEALLQER